MSSSLTPRIGPANAFCEEQRQWWAYYEPVVIDWMREQVERGATELEQILYGATTLLWAPDMRAGSNSERRPYCWDGIDAYELYFDLLAEGGIRDPWDPGIIVAAMRSFAAYLVRHGHIEPNLGAALERDLELWAPRLLAWYEGGPWWTREGVPANLVE